MSDEFIEMAGKIPAIWQRRPNFSSPIYCGTQEAPRTRDRLCILQFISVIRLTSARRPIHSSQHLLLKDAYFRLNAFQLGKIPESESNRSAPRAESIRRGRTSQTAGTVLSRPVSVRVLARAVGSIGCGGLDLNTLSL